jgi:RND family efflux transporter MFP subunit
LKLAVAGLPYLDAIRWRAGCLLPPLDLSSTMINRPFLPLLTHLRASCRLLSVTVLAIGLATTARGAEPKPAPVALAVNAAVVTSSRIARTLPVTGSIQAWQEIIIGPEVGGYRVDSVLVEVGDRVKRDQELVRLSSSMLEAEAAAKRAAVKQADAQLVNAEAALHRAEMLASTKVFSQADLDRLRSEQLTAQGRVEATRADLGLAELRVRYTRVKAPYDGVITARTVNVGQIAQSGAEMLRLLRDGRVEWRGEVPEARLKELKVGQIAKLTTADGTELTGKVRIVAPTVTSSNRMGLVYVDIVPGSPARPGMFARGVVETSSAEANLVPLSSIVSQDGYSYVFVLQAGDKVERRRVSTGSIQGDAMEITVGLKAGERVVAKGAAFLKNGDQVKVVAAGA